MAIDLPIGKSVIIGKEGGLKINNPTVSRRHCRLTRKSQNDYIIEDLNSSNGTYVDGLQTFQAPVTLNSHIKLGSFEATLGQILGYKIASGSTGGTGGGPNPSPTPAEEVAIDHLFPLYDSYDETMRGIQKSRGRMGTNRMLFMTIPGLIGTTCTFIPKPWNMIGGIVNVFIMIGITLYSYCMPGKSDDLVDRQFDANLEFQQKYTCPKCKNFLGNLSPKLLLKRGACPYCKSKFTTHHHHY